MKIKKKGNRISNSTWQISDSHEQPKIIIVFLTQSQNTLNSQTAVCLKISLFSSLHFV